MKTKEEQAAMVREATRLLKELGDLMMPEQAWHLKEASRTIRQWAKVNGVSR